MILIKKMLINLNNSELIDILVRIHTMDPLTRYTALWLNDKHNSFEMQWLHYILEPENGSKVNHGRFRGTSTPESQESQKTDRKRSN